MNSRFFLSLFIFSSCSLSDPVAILKEKMRKEEGKKIPKPEKWRRDEDLWEGLARTHFGSNTGYAKVLFSSILVSQARFIWTLKKGSSVHYSPF